MAHCALCGKPIFFLSAHPACEQKQADGRDSIKRLVYDAILSNKDLGVAKQQAEHLARASFVAALEMPGLIAVAWDTALDQAMSDNVLTQAELQRLHTATTALQIDADRLARMGVPQKMQAFKQRAEKEQALAASRQNLLNQLSSGQFPPYPYQVPPLPFMLDGSQVLIWLFGNVVLDEEKTRRRSVRNTQGFSYHGAYSGHSVSQSQEWKEMVNQGTGMMGLTSKYVYFASSSTTLRIPYGKLLTVKPYSDAIEVVKEQATPNRQIFRNMDGVFAYEIIKAIKYRST